MPTPSYRTPVRIARGTYSNLNSSINDLLEGEICYATDEDKLYVVEGGALVQTTYEPVWSRSGTTVAPTNAGDDVQNLDGDITAGGTESGYFTGTRSSNDGGLTIVNRSSDPSGNLLSSLYSYNATNNNFTVDKGANVYADGNLNIRGDIKVGADGAADAPLHIRNSTPFIRLDDTTGLATNLYSDIRYNNSNALGGELKFTVRNATSDGSYAFENNDHRLVKFQFMNTGVDDGYVELGSNKIKLFGSGAAEFANQNIIISSTGEGLYKAGQRGEITTVTSSSGVMDIDFNASNNFYIELTENITSVTATNATAGQSGSIFIAQPASGGPYTVGGWAAAFLFSGGTAPTITATNSKTDRVDYVIRASGEIQVVWTGNY